MIDVKEAVKIAKEFVTEIYDKPLPALQLEEVELTDDDSWLVTFGFDTDRLTEDESPIVAAFRGGVGIRPKYVRTYKIVKVDGESGKPKSMKIRTP